MLNFKALPYAKNSFQDLMSEETFSYHYDKHHQTYFNNLINLIKGSDLENWDLEKIIKHSYNNNDLKKIFNNSAQVFNHDFFWNSLSPDSLKPSEYLIKKIEDSFSSWETFREEFKKISLAQFASGWVWLIWEDDKLKIISSSNADTPIVSGREPLLCLDVWEHAYYLDYRNDRGAYFEVVFDKLFNWDFCEKNLKRILND